MSLISDLKKSWRAIAHPEFPGTMTTFVYEQKDKKSLIEMERMAAGVYGPPPPAKGIQWQIPVREYHQAIARRVRTPNGYMYRIVQAVGCYPVDYHDVKVGRGNYRETPSKMGDGRLFHLTRDQAVEFLRACQEALEAKYDLSLPQSTRTHFSRYEQQPQTPAAGPTQPAAPKRHRLKKLITPASTAGI